MNALLLAATPAPLWTTNHVLIVLNVLIGFVLPLLVNLVTARETNSSLKSGLLLALSIVTAFVTNLTAAVQGGYQFDYFTAILDAIQAFGTGVASQLGLWSQTGVDAGLQQLVGRHVARRLRMPRREPKPAALRPLLWPR